MLIKYNVTCHRRDYLGVSIQGIKIIEIILDFGWNISKSKLG
jgi:hypothetical protein